MRAPRTHSLPRPQGAWHQVRGTHRAARRAGLSSGRRRLDDPERAGRKAFALSANAEAAGFFERALAGCAGCQDPRDARAGDRPSLRAAHRPGRPVRTDRIRSCLEELVPFIASAGDKVRSARHAAFRCNHHLDAAEQRRAIEFGETGLRLAREYGDPRVEGQLLYRLGQSHHLLGDNLRAIALLEEQHQGDRRGA